MTVLHGAQTSTSLHLLCGDGDLDVMGFVPVCEDGAQGSVFPCPRWGNSACAAGAEHCTKCCRMQQNGDVENRQHHFVLLPSLCISSTEYYYD